MTEKPILVVEHEAQCPPGWVGEWLIEAGCALDVRRPYVGDRLPDDLAEHAAMVVLGGSMDADADEQNPWLAQVRSLIRAAADDDVPVLGICLGHQLAALAFGGEVGRNPSGQQIGVFDVGWRSEAQRDALFGPLVGDAPAVQWNNDIVTQMPSGAVVLAATSGGEIQAARFGSRVWGVQWHPEAGEAIISAWADNDRDHAKERGVDVDAHVGAVAAAEPELRSIWRQLAFRFADLARDPVPTR